MTISNLTNWFRAICPELAQKQLGQEGHATFASFYAISLVRTAVLLSGHCQTFVVPVHIRERAWKEAVHSNPCL